MLEDSYADILRKARFGLQKGLEAVAAESGLTVAAVRAAEKGERRPDDAGLRSLAAALGLDGEKLLAIAHDRYRPRPVDTASLPYDAYTLQLHDDRELFPNCHLFVWKGTGEALLVDPGAEPERVVAWTARHGARLRYVAITHGHRDHFEALGAVREAFPGARVVAPRGDAGAIAGLRGSDTLVSGGEALPLGEGVFEVRATPGHTEGGVCFALPGAIAVGDVLFAGSLGRASVGYERLLEGVVKEVLALPPATWIFTGHGPNTCVADERGGNAFFPVG